MNAFLFEYAYLSPRFGLGQDEYVLAEAEAFIALPDCKVSMVGKIKMRV